MDRDTRCLGDQPGGMVPDHPNDQTSVVTHLDEALEGMEDEEAKYHVREAYQKLVILTDRMPDRDSA